jgi:predicted O-linked N-acetylglucosamine transferase (SPINDLY family)
MDYRLTDAWADPIGSTEHLHTEKLVRLRTNWCFAEPADSPGVSVSDRAAVTFGSFNNLTKVTDAMLRAWAEILRAVPRSKLLLKAGALVAASARDCVRGVFGQSGIDADRVTLLDPLTDHSAHLAAYWQMDIALDTFPYHGTTTTCEALWMGVPVVTLAGRAHVSRVGVSLLNSASLPELIAGDVGEYVKIAVDLANDRDRLRLLRASLRERMKGSLLMNPREFTANVEAKFREMVQEARAK